MTTTRTATSLAGAVLAALVVLPMAPAAADGPLTTVDVLKQVDGEYVVETVTVPAATAEATADRLEATPEVVVAGQAVTYQVQGGYDPYWDPSDPQAASSVTGVWSQTRGAGQVVAVLDSASAIDHPDLAGAVLPGIDLATGAQDPWHGYGAAGIVAARAENGIGSAGMAPEAKILPVRVCGEGGCTSASVARGILWAADHGADVINMSLAGAGYSDVTAAAIRYALDKNVSVVASAGNDGLNGNPVMYPAANSGVIAVSATDPAGAPSDWAVNGWQVDISTVGESVTLTLPGGSYAVGSGTSFSGPAVAGAVALLRAAHPGIGTEDIQAALQAGAESSNWNRAYGAGRLVMPTTMDAADRAPMGVVVTPGPQQLAVSWPATPGATGYTVRVDGTVRAVVNTTATTIAGLTDGNQVAVDVQPDNGPRSRPVLASVGAPVGGTPVLNSVALRGTASSAILDLTAIVPGSGTGQISIIRDGISLGTIAFPFGAATTRSIGIGPMPTSETQWSIRAVWGYGRSSAASNVLSTGSGRPAPPSPVTGLSGQLDGDRALLTWDDLGTAYSYRVSVDGTVVATPRTAGAVTAAPAAGTSHDYSVVAVDAWGQTGPARLVTVARPGSVPPPVNQAPVAVADDFALPAQPGTRTLTVLANDSDPDGDPLQIVSATQGTSGTVTTTATATALSYTPSSPGPFLDTLTYTVGDGRGGTAVGTVTVSVAGPVTPPAPPAVPAPAVPAPPAVPAVPAPPAVRTPSAPRIGNASALAGGVQVTWAAPADDGGAAITGYRVTAFQGASPVKVATVDRRTSTTITGLANGVTYRIGVTALNSAGSGPESAAVTATPRTKPSAPKVTAVTARKKAVVVRWAKPASTGGAPVTGYVVQVYSGGKLVKSVTAGATKGSATVTGLKPGKAYTFRVLAKNIAGSSAVSAPSKATRPR